MAIKKIDASAKKTSASTASSPKKAPLLGRAPPPEELKHIDRRELVKLLQARLTSEGKTINAFATEIGMPSRIAEVVIQGTSLPGWHRVKQFIDYLGIQASDAPSVEATTAVKPKGNHIFISYSHKDSEYLERLLVHLKPLQREGLIDTWVDTRLLAGDRWKKEIDSALKKARVAILLVSADFLASDFIINNELPPLLKSAEEQGTLIVPVVLKPCRFVRNKDLRDFQSINPPDEPLSVLDENGRELLYDAIAQRIEQVLS